DEAGASDGGSQVISVICGGRFDPCPDAAVEKLWKLVPGRVARGIRGRIAPRLIHAGHAPREAGPPSAERERDRYPAASANGENTNRELTRRHELPALRRRRRALHYADRE